MTSRDEILHRLKAAPRPFDDLTPPAGRLAMVPVENTRPEALRALFAEQAQKLSCRVQTCSSAEEARHCLLTIIGDDRRILSWSLEHIPLPGLAETLAAAGITIADSNDPSVRVGVTGAEAALAATGSLVLASGPGQPRLASLLPLVHVAVITTAQIVPTLEAWADRQRAAGLDRLRATSSVVVISGPSRTADIAMELVMGAHGPAEVHILILP